jgi:purine-binding chemotaxis protein CheW
MTQDSSLEKSRMSLTMQDYLQVVSFTLGAEEYAIEIHKVKEIILVEGITRVPQLPAYIEGVINLRGMVIPVVDLRKRLGVGGTGRDEHTRIMVTRLGGTIVGMIVDAVSRVMRIPKADIQPPPDTIASLAGEYLVGVARLADRMQLLLDIEKVLGGDATAGLLPAASATCLPPNA